MKKIIYYVAVLITIVVSIAMVMSAGRDGVLWALYGVLLYAMVKVCRILKMEAKQ